MLNNITLRTKQELLHTSPEACILCVLQDISIDIEVSIAKLVYNRFLYSAWKSVRVLEGNQYIVKTS